MLSSTDNETIDLEAISNVSHWFPCTLICCFCLHMLEVLLRNSELFSVTNRSILLVTFFYATEANSEGGPGALLH